MSGVDVRVALGSSGAAYVPGGTDVVVADGGTGASTRTGAQANLGLLSSRTTAQFDKTNALLANVPGLTLTLLAGLSYTFRAVLQADSQLVDGTQYAIGGTCTASAIIYEILIQTDSGGMVSPTRQTALGGASGEAAGAGTAFTTIEGLITVANAGTLTVQFSKASAVTGTSSLLIGSTFVAQEIP